METNSRRAWRYHEIFVRHFGSCYLIYKDLLESIFIETTFVENMLNFVFNTYVISFDFEQTRTE